MMSEKYSLNLENKVVIITGASSGVGEGIAIGFAGQGCHLTLCGRDQSRLEAVKTKCQEGNGLVKVELVSGDIVDREVQQRIIDVTKRAFGKIDILVNNAAVLFIRNPSNTEMEAYDQMMRTNVESVFFLTQLAIPYLKESQGNVINISGIISQRAEVGFTAYVMSKAALDSYTKSLSLYLAPFKVRVNSILPATVESRLYRTEMNEEEYKQFKARQATLHPLGRIVKSSEVGDAAVFLASDRAGFITGQFLYVDGGRSHSRGQCKIAPNLL